MNTKTDHELANGAAIAAVLSAAIGSFALGIIVLFKAMGLIAIPAFYEPAGGVSGRTTVAVIIWLIAWGILHYRWRDRHISYRRSMLYIMILIVCSIVLTFPPFWSIF